MSGGKWGRVGDLERVVGLWRRHVGGWGVERNRQDTVLRAVRHLGNLEEHLYSKIDRKYFSTY